MLLPPDSYQIQATFFRALEPDGHEPLGSDARLRVNDRLHLAVETSAPTYLYVVNEDDAGRAFLLFPLREADRLNPIPGGSSIRVPDKYDWAVNSASTREHFIVFASPEQVPALEEAFQKLPSPREPLAHETLAQLRGVGQLAPVAPRATPSTRFRDTFTIPLAGRETARGLWARQLSVASSTR